MLPPIDDAIIQSNPRFAILHNTLAKQILNANGSTKMHPAQRERDVVSEALRASRLRSAKVQFLKSALRNLDISSTTATTPSSSSSSIPPTRSSRQSHTQVQIQPPPKTQSLPPELLELLLLLPSYLTTSLPPSKLALLSSTPTWSSLNTHLPTISTLISTHLHTQTLSLCRLLHPNTNPSFQHRNIPKLVPAILLLREKICNERASLGARRGNLVGHTNTLLTLHHLATTLVIQTLEQVAHGSLSRHIKARSEFLALKAGHVLCEAKSKMERGEKMVYTDEVRGALENYMRELRMGRERGKEREGQARRVLWGYGVGRADGDDGGKEKVLKECARVYKELLREVEEVGRDVERLRGR